MLFESRNTQRLKVTKYQKLVYHLGIPMLKTQLLHYSIKVKIILIMYARSDYESINSLIKSMLTPYGFKTRVSNSVSKHNMSTNKEHVQTMQLLLFTNKLT